MRWAGTRWAFLVLATGAGLACARAPSPEPSPPPATPPPTPAETPLSNPVSATESLPIDAPIEANAVAEMSFEEQLRGALGTVYFGYNRAVVDEAAKDRLTALADLLRARPEAIIEIEGHCDVRGSTEYNLHLGERRARSVLKYLVTQGVPMGQLRLISYGEERPVDYGSSEDAHAANRRAELRAP